MRTLPYYHAYANRSHPVAGELAEALIGIAPDGMSKVFFANSGSEALDTAVKIVWFYNNVLGRPEKKKIIARERAYHGANIASGSLTGLAAFHHGFDLPREFVVRTACPHHYRFAEVGEDEAAFATRLAAELEALILREGPDTIGAFVAEPVMGGGGVLIPPEGYFPKVQAVLAKYDILSIADEVICGFGRTGNMWGCQTYDFVPDIVTSAKALSSAYLPISAVMISEPIYAALLEESGRSVMFGHGYTYSAHPVTAAVALETLRIYEERDIVGMVRIAAPHFQARLRALGDHPLVGQTRGVGLLGALELMRDGAARIPFDAADGVPARCCAARGARPLDPRHGRLGRPVAAADHYRRRGRRDFRPIGARARRRMVQRCRQIGYTDYGLQLRSTIHGSSGKRRKIGRLPGIAKRKQ